MREGENDNAVNRVEVEDAAKIRFSAKIHGEKRKRAENEARAKAEAEIR